MCFLFLLLLYLLLSDCLLGKAPLVSLVPSAYIPSMQREQSKSEHHLPIIYRSSKCSLRGHHMFSPKTYAKNLASKEHRLDYSQPFPTLPLRRDTPSHEALHNGYCKWRKNEASLFAHIALDASSFFKKCSFSAIRTAHIRTGSCDEASPAGTLRSIQVKLSCACHVSPGTQLHEEEGASGSFCLPCFLVALFLGDRASLPPCLGELFVGAHRSKVAPQSGNNGPPDPPDLRKDC